MPKNRFSTRWPNPKLHPRLLTETAWVGDFELPLERPLTTEEAAELLHTSRTKVDGEYTD